jgi:hypothetical protein
MDFKRVGKAVLPMICITIALLTVVLVYPVVPAVVITIATLVYVFLGFYELYGDD